MLLVSSAKLLGANRLPPLFLSLFLFFFVDLHWLPVEGGIEYNIATICYSVITCTAPPYLSDRLQRYIPSRTLRSSADNLTFCIPNRRKSQGQRAFSIIDLSVWDTLPFSVQHAHTLSAFGSQLKTHLFFLLFFRRSCRDWNPQPFNHESGVVPLSCPRNPSLS